MGSGVDIPMIELRVLVVRSTPPIEIKLSFGGKSKNSVRLILPSNANKEADSVSRFLGYLSEAFVLAMGEFQNLQTIKVKFILVAEHGSSNQETGSGESLQHAEGLLFINLIKQTFPAADSRVARFSLYSVDGSSVVLQFNGTNNS